MISTKKCTTENFIEKSKNIFGDLYDYSKVNYVHSKIKVELICKKHGSFLVRPNDHLNRNTGCQICSRIKIGLINRNKNWLNDFISVHGDRYDYTKVEYINNKTKVEIICKEHGSFFMKPNSHVIQKQGCYKCSRAYTDTETFIDASKNIHLEEYDYSNVKYEKSHKKVEIICREHGSFFMRPCDHINQKQRCPKCGKISMSNKHRKKISSLINQFIELNGDRYDYSKVEYKNNYTKVEIVCKEHGSFLQIPKSHLRGDGCPKCSNSKGERRISRFLDKINIDYLIEFKFDDCRDILTLPFDFYLPNHNLCIEYDGEQHFKSIDWFGGQKNFERQQKRDYIKNMYCLNNKISLIRISYLDYEKIEDILDFLIK